MRLTGAVGVAVGVIANGSLECVASAGERVPEVGTRVPVEQGISGVCIRSGELLYCRDTERDARVNVAASRALGIRSLAVAPLRCDEAVIGFIEVFSTTEGGFTDNEIMRFRKLAEAVAFKSAREDEQRA